MVLFQQMKTICSKRHKHSNIYSVFVRSKAIGKVIHVCQALQHSDTIMMTTRRGYANLFTIPYHAIPNMQYMRVHCQVVLNYQKNA